MSDKLSGKQTDILAYLYDADGSDREVQLDENVCENLSDKKLLWVNILKRDREMLDFTVRCLRLKDFPFETVLRISERPKIDQFEHFYRFHIVSVQFFKEDKIEPMAIDFVVGRNFVITIHEGDVSYLQEYRDAERGETQLGNLDAETFVTTLLDMHIVTYFRALENIEQKVDHLDGLILKRDLDDRDFIHQMVKLRGNVSRLRRWFLPHRDLFYALSRPDFKPFPDSETTDYQLLDNHFENAVDAIESSRDTVLSLFDLYTTKSSHNTNKLMKRLTFITLMVGGIGAIAGIWGMNFEVKYFKAGENGFWLTIAGMGLFILLGYIVGKLTKWL